MAKTSEGIRHVKTVRAIPYAITRPPPEMSTASFLNIDIYRTKHLVILKLCDAFDDEEICSVNLDSDVARTLPQAIRKANNIVIE